MGMTFLNMRVPPLRSWRIVASLSGRDGRTHLTQAWRPPSAAAERRLGRSGPPTGSTSTRGSVRREGVRRSERRGPAPNDGRYRASGSDRERVGERESRPRELDALALDLVGLEGLGLEGVPERRPGLDHAVGAVLLPLRALLASFLTSCGLFRAHLTALTFSEGLRHASSLRGNVSLGPRNASARAWFGRSASGGQRL